LICGFCEFCCSASAHKERTAGIFPFGSLGSFRKPYFPLHLLMKNLAMNSVLLKFFNALVVVQRGEQKKGCCGGCQGQMHDTLKFLFVVKTSDEICR